MLPSRFLFPWPRSLVARQRQNFGAGGVRGVQDFLGVGAVVFVWVWVAMMGLGLRWALGLRRVLPVTGFFLMAGVSGAEGGREWGAGEGALGLFGVGGFFIFARECDQPGSLVSLGAGGVG